MYLEVSLLTSTIMWEFQAFADFLESIVFKEFLWLFTYTIRVITLNKKKYDKVILWCND